MTRLKRLFVRLTDEEVVTVKATAKGAGMSVSDHVRTLYQLPIREKGRRRAPQPPQ